MNTNVKMGSAASDQTVPSSQKYRNSLTRKQHRRWGDDDLVTKMLRETERREAQLA